MAVKAAYKHTDLGRIPGDWEVRPVGDFALVRTGPFGTLLKASEYSREGVPLISVGEVREGFLKVGDETPRVSKAVLRRLPQYVLRKGDIVFGRKGGVDRSALVTDAQDGWFLGSDGISLRTLPGMNYQYIAHQLRSARVQKWLAQHAIGTTMPSLNQRILRDVLVPFPPTLAEQQAIAAALSDADVLTQSLGQLIAKKRLIKLGAMQALLLGQRRLPGYHENWETRRLGQVATMRSGGTPPSSIEAYYGGAIPWVSIADMTVSGKFVEQTERHLTPSGLLNSSAQMFPAGSVLYAMYASLGECSIAGVELCTSQAILGIQCGERLNAGFLYYWLCAIKPSVKAMGQHGTQANLNKGMVEKFELQLPSPPEQASIVEILSDIDDELDALERRHEKTIAIKQGMMQQLLTGRIRLI
jgi:type I restriction enzyme S subunit